MNETNLTRRIMLALSAVKGLRLFRNNTGMGWVGEIIKRWKERGDEYITIKNPRPLHAGLCEGSSDLIGWRSIEVTPDMVGKRIAVFTVVEVKRPGGRASVMQVNFMNRVREAGGIVALLHSEQEAITTFC